MEDVLELSVPDNCGNSPQKKFLVDFNRAFAEGNVYTFTKTTGNTLKRITSYGFDLGKQAIRLH